MRSGSRRPPGPDFAQPHVRRGRDDVQVLRSRQVDEERQHEQQVEPDEHPFGDARASRSKAVDEPDEPARRPVPPTSVRPERDARRLPQQQRDDDRRDHQQDAVGFLEVRSAEAVGLCTFLIATAVITPASTRDGEHVDQPGEPWPCRRSAAGPVAVHDRDRRLGDRGEQHDEPPEDRGVHQPGHEPLEELALADDLDELARRALPGRPATVGIVGPRSAQRRDPGGARGARRARPRRPRRRPSSAALSARSVGGPPR